MVPQRERASQTSTIRDAPFETRKRRFVHKWTDAKV
jgi:hypothetical protein